MALPCALSLFAEAPATAQPSSRFEAILDSIIVFSPVLATASGELRQLNLAVDGITQTVYLAAFSPDAVLQVVQGQLARQNPELARSIRFAPFSLAKFESLVRTDIQRNLEAKVVYVPDPSQVSTTQMLLASQGLSHADAAQTAKRIPAIFCPQPAFQVTPESGPLKDQSFVPCSTDFQTVQTMMDRANAQSLKLNQQQVKVIAIPVSNFVSMLAKGTDQEVGAIRVLPSPATIQVLQEMRSKTRIRPSLD